MFLLRAILTWIVARGYVHAYFPASFPACVCLCLSRPGTGAGARAQISVSYTHLDVYKRQVYDGYSISHALNAIGLSSYHYYTKQIP